VATLLEKLVIVCTIINGLEVLFILVFKNHLPPLIPFFYGLPISNQQLAEKTTLALLPLISEGLIIINLGIAKFAKDEFLEKISGGFTILVTILALVAVLKIFMLVGSFH